MCRKFSLIIIEKKTNGFMVLMTKPFNAYAAYDDCFFKWRSFACRSGFFRSWMIPNAMSTTPPHNPNHVLNDSFSNNGDKPKYANEI